MLLTLLLLRDIVDCVAATGIKERQQ